MLLSNKQRYRDGEVQYSTDRGRSYRDGERKTQSRHRTGGDRKAKHISQGGTLARCAPHSREERSHPPIQEGKSKITEQYQSKITDEKNIHIPTLTLGLPLTSTISNSQDPESVRT